MELTANHREALATKLERLLRELYRIQDLIPQADNEYLSDSLDIDEYLVRSQINAIKKAIKHNEI